MIEFDRFYPTIVLLAEDYLLTMMLNFYFQEQELEAAKEQERLAKEKEEKEKKDKEEKNAARSSYLEQKFHADSEGDDLVSVGFRLNGKKIIRNFSKKALVQVFFYYILISFLFPFLFFFFYHILSPLSSSLSSSIIISNYINHSSLK